ncbi:MAG: hypothetical protein KatS3mg008_2246 [Acidimicrobiales bacterium]|nr:MAG: hypothetical protein KatS3mg008_2246 [Acidimicrobiales bacterium]
MSVFLEVDPGDWLASNELAFAIRDRFPVTPGHSLVVPRRVFAEWWDATPQEKRAMLELVEVVKRRLDAEYAPAGYNVGFNSGRAAGQTVDHLHIHVIPRYWGDVPDPRGGIRHVIPERANYLARRPAESPHGQSLVTSLGGRLKLELIRCLLRPDLDRIDLLVSFVMRSGVDLVARHLDDALGRGATVRLLTTDYLQITDTSALGFFLDRSHGDGPGSLEVRVFSDPATSFHPKAYIFWSSSSGDGVAFVGSSNLSRSGIVGGIEWNVETRHVAELRAEFESLWSDPRAIPVTHRWLERYEEIRRRRLEALSAFVEAGETTAEASAELLVEAAGENSAVAEREQGRPLAEAAPHAKIAAHQGVASGLAGAPRPWSVQAEALAALEATRIEGHRAGLVVMATGLGKTWLAAFDSTRPEFRRVLFVAHREEILRQARDVYRRVRPAGALTMYTGAERDQSGEVVFAGVQSLHRNLGDFRPDEFDYVVVDEFHHAAARTYRRVLAHFRPKFVLGLTATPNRADAADLLALCSDNLVYDCGLVEGVSRGLLCPFTYRAIRDVADYEQIPWRNGRFDLEALTASLATARRARQALDEWRAAGGESRRTLGFCCTIAHAEFMAEQFRQQGVSAVAVHSGASSAPRAETLERLARGDLDVIFTVDVFNEGVDIPEVDLVLMLRPTESPVVFFQQLGRGLRRADGKERLDVVDLVGNHRSFLLKARLLAELAGRRNATDHEAVDFLRRCLGEGHTADAESSPGLPPGCSIVVETEVVDLLAELAGRRGEEERLLALARQWSEDHEGRRPTALELSLAAGGPLTLRRRGGWFGFLSRAGMLSPEEAEVVEAASDFLLWIEHGSYTKSFKLVTLAVLARSGGLRAGMPLAELAAACRWEIMRDPDLRADLYDATSAFADPSTPTISEWMRYWRKNPIRALTTPNRGSEPWFRVVDGRLTLELDVPERLGETFDALVTEIVEYRLHRYLVGRQARRVGERRTLRRDGEELDVTLVVETSDGRPTSVVVEAVGSRKGSGTPGTAEYEEGLRLLLERLRAVRARVLDVYVDAPKKNVDLAVADRRLDPGAMSYPLCLDELPDLDQLTRALLASRDEVGCRAGPAAARRLPWRTRLVISLENRWAPAALADALAGGEIPAEVVGSAKKTARQ